MAYSDYGGYAYKNGVRVVERSDAVLSPEGIKSTPGQWPGWTLAEGRSGGSYHALLGDGPIFVGLYKQGLGCVSRLGEELDVLSLGENVAFSEWEGRRYFDVDHYRDSEKPLTLTVDGFRIELRFVYADNYYVFARVEQPDGSVWCGWSGYGVGAGLEDADYGFGTGDCDDALLEFWPDAIA